MSQRRATRLVAPPLMKNDHSDGSNIPWLHGPRPVGPGTKHIFWHPTIEESDQRVSVNTNGIQWLNYQDCKICKYYKQLRTNSNQAACLFLRGAATFFRWRTQLWDPDSPCPLLRYHGYITAVCIMIQLIFNSSDSSGLPASFLKWTANHKDLRGWFWRSLRKCPSPWGATILETFGTSSWCNFPVFCATTKLGR